MVETETQQCRMVVKTSDKSDKSGGDKLKLSNDVGAVVTSLRDATFADKTFRAERREQLPLVLFLICS